MESAETAALTSLAQAQRSNALLQPTNAGGRRQGPALPGRQWTVGLAHPRLSAATGVEVAERVRSGGAPAPQ